MEEPPPLAPLFGGVDVTPESPARVRGRPFTGGQSGNPAGRPKGSRNKLTLKAEALLEANAEEIVAKLVRCAQEGDVRALKACVDRLIPVRRQRAISVSIPEIRTPSDAKAASTALIAACADGEISTNEAREVMDLISQHIKIFEVSELHAEIETLKSQIKMASENRG